MGPEVKLYGFKMHYVTHWGKNQLFYPEITKNLMFEKCEFCEKWDFENVNFVKNEISERWIL